MQHRFYGSPVKSPIGESSFITHVQCALINFTLKYKINSKNNDSTHDPHLFYVHILLTTFLAPYTPSTRSITYRFLSLEGEHTYLAIPPSNTQHPVSHKCCYRNHLFLILLLLQTTEKLNTSLCWLRSKGYHLFFFVGVFVLKK